MEPPRWWPEQLPEPPVLLQPLELRVPLDLLEPQEPQERRERRERRERLPVPRAGDG